MAKSTHKETSGAAPAAVVNASALVMTLEPGLYAVDIAATESARAGRGMVLPCVQVGPLPGDGPNAGRAFVSTMNAGTLILPGGNPAYIRVEAGSATVLVTSYHIAGVQVAPQLRVLAVGAAAPPAAPEPPPGLPSLPLDVLAHVERLGDMSAPGGHWVGSVGKGAVIEGFAITPRGEVRASDIEYQAMLGRDWNTPWMRGDEFCGSRGMSLSMVGLRVRLAPRASKRFTCVYGGRFADAGEVGPVSDGAACSAGDAPMEAFWVSLREREASTTIERLLPKRARKT
jgi:hypothetical protein